MKLELETRRSCRAVSFLLRRIFDKFTVFTSRSDCSLVTTNDMNIGLHEATKTSAQKPYRFD